MVLDGPDRNEQAARDLLVGLALRNELKNLLLACGETVRVCLRCRTSPSGNRADTKIAHGTAYQASRRVGTKINKPCQRLSKMGLLLGVQQRQCGLIRTAQPIPEHRSPRAVTCQL